MALNLTKTVIDFLQAHPEQRFTAREIAEWILINHRSACEEKRQKSISVNYSRDLSTDEGFLNQLVAEIGSKKPRIVEKCPKIKTVEGRPRKYYFTEKSEADEVKTAEASAPTNIESPSEHELYIRVSNFLLSELGIYSKRIDEKRSKNSYGPRGNIWLHPDIVGLEDLSTEWDREIKDCVKEYGDRKTKLWSFEVKILVNRSNVRESFFQAVSNSSWANFGYLVAAEIQGADTLKEMRMLAGLHGIGFILLNAGNPAESEIVIPAREREKIDWSAANRLAEENKDFLDYIRLVKQFYQTGEVRPGDWDVSDAGDL